MALQKIDRCGDGDRQPMVTAHGIYGDPDGRTVGQRHL
jgi:hypothetical protein